MSVPGVPTLDPKTLPAREIGDSAPAAESGGKPARSYAVPKADALVIGGGLAGTSVATLLAAAGREVVLVEKSAAAQPKVCGEFLSHEALHYLAELGLDLEALGAVPIERVRLIDGDKVASSPLPFRSFSLTRECLDEALLVRAKNSGVQVLRPQRVQALEEKGSDWVAHLGEGATILSRAAFLASGKHDLYGWHRPAGKQNDLLAFKMYWRLSSAASKALERHVELVLFPGGYAGLQPVENSRANLCLLVRRETFQKIGGSWSALLAHMQRYSAHLTSRLADAIACWERPLSLSSIPYGYVRKQAAGGLWRLGDQAAVIPSFAGDGMSIALHSARLAAAMHLAGNSADAFQQRLAEQVQRQVSLATLLSRALVNPKASAVLSMAARGWPCLLAGIASSTRVRARDLLK